MNKKQKNKKESIQLGIIYPNSASLDVGSMNMVVSYQGDNQQSVVQKYGSYTEELHAMAQALIGAGVIHVAMEATGVYWMAVCEILEQYGLQVTLVNARH